MHSFADATPAEPVWRAHVAALQDTALQDTAPQDTAPQDTDATVLLLVSRDTGLASALLDGTFPGALRLHMVRTPAAALAFLARHSPDAVVLDAATCLPEEPRLSGELAFMLRRRNVPLVVATPAGRAAQAFLRTCAARAVDVRRSGGRSGETLGALARAGIERRTRRLRLASVLTPLARTGACGAAPAAGSGAR